MAVIAASAALTGLNVAGAVMKGMAGRDAAKHQMAQASRAAQYGQIQAQQAARAMSEQFQFSMANIEAVRAAAGQDPNSPTGAALTNYAQTQADRERVSKASNILTQVSEQQRAARFYQKSAGNQMLGGLLSAAGELAKGVSGGMKSGGGEMGFGLNG